MKIGKELRLVLIALSVLFLIASCTKDKIVTKTIQPKGDSLALILAGSVSKTWQLVSISETDKDAVTGSTSSGFLTTSDIASCQTDNLFEFANNSTQDYIQTEGSSACNVGQTDPTTIEKGSWALTNDGKNLIIDAIENVNNTQFQNEDDPANKLFLFYFLLNQGVPMKINSLSSTTLILSYTGSYTDSSTNHQVNYTVTLTFGLAK